MGNFHLGSSFWVCQNLMPKLTGTSAGGQSYHPGFWKKRPGRDCHKLTPFWLIRDIGNLGHGRSGRSVGEMLAWFWKVAHGDYTCARRVFAPKKLYTLEVASQKI